MTTPTSAETADAPAAAPARDDRPAQASWREVALYAAGRAAVAGRRAAGVVRPIGWVAIGAGALLWVVGLWLGWR